MVTSKTLPLLRDHVTLSAALRRDDDVIHKLGLCTKRIDFYLHLYKHRAEIETIVSFHLGLGLTETCCISEVTNWIAGSFNVCIPVDVTYHAGKNREQATRVLIRIPLPYKVGEEGNPGNADEKLRCEAATYLWIQQHCPEIRTPRLLAFGFSDGPCFTAPENAPFYTRFALNLRQIAYLLSGRSIPCNYISRPSPVTLRIGYLIVEYIEESQGKMLSSSWEEGRHDQKRRKNLFRDLSRIMLSLSRTSLPHIGSLTINNEGITSLTNRPLTLELEQLENENIPTNISRSTTYSAVDMYLLDLLDCHDSRLQNQRNAIRGEEDGRNQIAAIVIMRAMLSRFTSRDYRYGPFILTLTDTHQSNIFVDSDWHITHMIDLEWACSLPIEMLQPPHWLTGRGVDELEKGEHLLAFAELYEEFMDIFEQEELLCTHATVVRQPLHLSRTMRNGWRVGSFWYFKAISSPSGLLSLFFEHIYPIAVDAGEYRRVLTPFWGQDANKFIAAKLADKRQYDTDLRTAFEESLDKS